MAKDNENIKKETKKENNIKDKNKLKDVNIQNNMNDKKKKFKIVTLILIIVLVIIALTFGYLLFAKEKFQNKMSYNEKMDIIGFTSYYSDDSEYVKKIDAIKIIECCVLNQKDVYGLYYTNATDDDGKAIEVAYDKQIAPLNYLKNKDENISLVDVLMLLGFSKQYVLEKDIDDTQDIKLKDYDKYYDLYQKYIKDMLVNEIIENKEVDLNGYESITKSQFSEIMVKYMYKYNLLANTSDEKIDYTKSMNLTKKSTYPFVLEGLDKKAYNKKYEVKNKEKFLTPNEVYKKFGRSAYGNLDYYFQNILNIDYENIDLYKIWGIINIFHEVSKEDAQKYVDYVKDNKIKVSTTCKVVDPIIYYDGENYRLRIQIEYDNSNANKNLFILDDINSKIKCNKKGTAIVDLKVELNDTGYIMKIL